MKDQVKNSIKQFYPKVDSKLYLKKCQERLILPESIDPLIKQLDISINEFPEFHIWPSQGWIINYKEVLEDKFLAKFTTQLKISKIASFFYIQHEFSIKNEAPDKMDPELGGYGCTPYIIGQYDIEEELVSSLTQGGYTRLFEVDMDEVIPELSFPEGVTFFGPQVTVEYALFHDLLELCPD
jgi:hypothetical protein